MSIRESLLANEGGGDRGDNASFHDEYTDSTETRPTSEMVNIASKNADGHGYDDNGDSHHGGNGELDGSGQVKPMPKTLWTPIRTFGAIAALVCYVLMQFIRIETPTDDEFVKKFKKADFRRVNECFAILLPMVFMWLFNVFPPNVTALFPLVFMPILAIQDSTSVAKIYLNNVSLLFIGLFMVATAMEVCNLHRRFALATLNAVAKTPATFMLSFMLPPFFLSFVSSNAGATALMLPIAVASMEATIRNAEENGDLEEVKNLKWFEKGLYMSIAYSATIGGVTTIIATPPNAIVVTEVEKERYPEITFAQWMGAFLGLGIVLQVCNFLIMFATYGRNVKRIDRTFIAREYSKLGPMNRDEKVVGLTFFVLVVWMVIESFTTKQVFGSCKLVNRTDHNVEAHHECIEEGGEWKGTFKNGSICILCGMFLFLVPSVIDKRRSLLTWKQASAGIPWGLLMLLGSGNALSQAFQETQTTVYIATYLEPLGKLDLLPITLIVSTIVAFLTELASNTATTSILLPIFIQFANNNNRHPLCVGLTCALSASMAFMLPIATPTNAVALGSGRLAFTDFIRVGWKMNFLGVLCVSAFVCTLGDQFFGLTNPEEAWKKNWACKSTNTTCP